MDSMTKQIFTAGVYAERDMILKVIDLDRIADGVVSISLARVDGNPMPPWEPGAHLEIDVPEIGVRHYSLCGVPKDRSHWKIAVRLADVSKANASLYFHTGVQIGDEFHVFAPRNNFRFALPAPGEQMHLIAGGIGITPILPMAAAAHEAGVEWTMTYFGRSLDTMPFLGELSRYGDRVRVFTDDGEMRVTVDELLGAAKAGDLVYSCGPAPLIADADMVSGQRELRHRSELFSFSGSTAQRDDDKAFELECRTSGITIEVEATETIVEALEKNGLTPRTSCRIGMCGSCETRVIVGEPDHRDSLLSDYERENGNSMMVCVGRAQGDRLVLDI